MLINMTINYKASSIKRSLMKSTDDSEDNMDTQMTDEQVTELYNHEALGVLSNSIAGMTGGLGRFFKQ